MGRLAVKAMNETDVKLSVSLITYNQKNFIAQTIDGVLRQTVDFKYEIIIGDDCSTDGTRDILLEYQKKHPQLIKLIIHPQKNAGIPGKENFLSTIYAARGKYIALLDGDDYWTDELKLQKQVDFLEANADYAICFHCVKVQYESDERQSYISNENQKETATFEDLTAGNFIHTPSCVFRARLFGDFPGWFQDMPVGDYVLHLLNAQFGKIKFLEDSMAVYRVHDRGVWSSEARTDLLLKWVKVIETCRKHFAPRGEKGFAKQIADSYKEICFAYFDEEKYSEFRKYYAKLSKVSAHLEARIKIALAVRYALSFAPSVAARYKVARAN